MKNYIVSNRYITLDEFARDFDKPGLLMRLRELPPDVREQFVREVAQFQRAEDGARIRPDLLPSGNGFKPGRSTSPGNDVSTPEAPWGYATPFAPKDSHRPDRLAHPEVMKTMRERVERVNTELATADLQERLGTDVDRPLDPPTLRDHLEAAYEIHTQGDN